MKLVRISSLFCATAVALSLLAGCNQKVEAPAKTTYDPAPAAQTSVKPVVAANTIPYFSQNLDEAKKTWAACLAKGAANMEEAERQTCSNAHAAWEMQPYKAKK